MQAKKRKQCGKNSLYLNKRNFYFNIRSFRLILFLEKEPLGYFVKKVYWHYCSCASHCTHLWRPSGKFNNYHLYWLQTMKVLFWEPLWTLLSAILIHNRCTCILLGFLKALLCQFWVRQIYKFVHRSCAQWFVRQVVLGVYK